MCCEQLLVLYKLSSTIIFGMIVLLKKRTAPAGSEQAVVRSIKKSNKDNAIYSSDEVLSLL